MIKLLAVTVVGLWLAFAALLFVCQRALMYFPDRRSGSPSDSGLDRGQALALRTSDGETIQAWFVPPERDAPLFLYFHGNGGSLLGRVHRFAALTADGSGLLAIDYRGYGGSTGTPTERGLLLDGEAAYGEAVIRSGTHPLVVVGESLGTGVAVSVAARHRVAAVVLDAAYSATVDIAASQYWMLPVRLLMLDQFRSDQRITEVHAPILFLHGTDDPIIPIRYAERLFALAREPKTFIAIPGGGHTVLSPALIASRLRPWVVAVLHGSTAAP